MDDATREENEFFETEVRRIARELWPEASGTGGPAIVDGKERDGIFETEECVHLLEATTSRRKDKAADDVRKLVALALRVRKGNGSKAIKCWFITRDDPTADQRGVAGKHSDLISALSFNQFQSKLIDASAYLSARNNYRFGSVRDPGTGETVTKIDYIPLDLLNITSRTPMSVEDLPAALISGEHCVVLGDYGAGKSMTLRYLYEALRKRYLRNSVSHLPVYVNLRDHFGQTDPAEILERHAKSVGFAHPVHLVRAWRAGYVILLLDGFDEVSTVGIQGLWKKLQDNRYRAMEPVRRFVRDHPTGAGLALTGRAHFFDSERERHQALDLRSGTIELSLTEFTEDQIRSYLKKTGLTGSVPSWLPSRPLLIGYLAAKGLLQPLTEGGAGPEPAGGWTYLLDAITDREAEIEAGIDGHTIRRILERLATKARSYKGSI